MAYQREHKDPIADRILGILSVACFLLALTLFATAVVISVSLVEDAERKRDGSMAAVGMLVFGGSMLAGIVVIGINTVGLVLGFVGIVVAKICAGRRFWSILGLTFNGLALLAYVCGLIWLFALLQKYDQRRGEILPGSVGTSCCCLHLTLQAKSEKPASPTLGGEGPRIVAVGERGDLKMAYAHFIAAAALKPGVGRK